METQALALKEEKNKVKKVKPIRKGTDLNLTIYDVKKLDSKKMYRSNCIRVAMGIDELIFEEKSLEKLVDLGKLIKHGNGFYSLATRPPKPTVRGIPEFKGLIGKNGTAYAFNYFNKTFTVYENIETFLAYGYPSGVATIAKVLLDLPYDRFFVFSVNQGFADQGRVIATGSGKLMDGSNVTDFLRKQKSSQHKEVKITELNEGHELKYYTSFYSLYD